MNENLKAAAYLGAVGFVLWTLRADYRERRNAERRDRVYQPPYFPNRINGAKKVVGLSGATFPKWLALKTPIKKLDDVYRMDVIARTGEQVGFLEVALCGHDEYAAIVEARLDEFRGIGIYPAMLTKMRNRVKKDGCKGLVSYDSGRVGEHSGRSWEKFAAHEKRVTVKGKDYYFNGLPKTGRIPLATVKRALARLPKKTQKCVGVTPAALRVGMEIEREHRDVTRGAVGTTAKIAAAHICERPDYYKRIKRYVEK